MSQSAAGLVKLASFPCVPRGTLTSDRGIAGPERGTLAVHPRCSKPGYIDAARRTARGVDHLILKFDPPNAVMCGEAKMAGTRSVFLGQERPPLKNHGALERDVDRRDSDREEEK